MNALLKFATVGFLVAALVACSEDREQSASSSQATAKRVATVLMRPGWENGPLAVAKLQELIASHNLDVTVESVVVRTEEEAQRLRFPGSPTVLVSGVDIDPAARLSTSFGFTWRFYPDHALGHPGVPGEAMVRKALVEAGWIRE